MSLNTTKKYELGNTVYFECLYRNLDGFPTDPSTSAYTITNIKGETVASGNPNKRKDGYWYCFWTLTETGDFILKFTGTIEENVVIIRKKFKVIETKLS